MAIWRMRTACWIPKATSTHTEYVILIANFPLQQRLHERSPVLRYTYTGCLVHIRIFYSGRVPVTIGWRTSGSTHTTVLEIMY
jgi:hypothetical protein